MAASLFVLQFSRNKLVEPLHRFGSFAIRPAVRQEVCHSSKMTQSPSFFLCFLSWISISARAPGVKTERSRADLADEQSSAGHGNILKKHDHLHLLYHGISNGPEVVHHEGDGNEKQHDKPGAYTGAISEQDTQTTGNRHES